MSTEPPDDDVPVETPAADTQTVVETAVPTEPPDDDVPVDTAAADTLTVVETFMPTEPPDDARIHMRLNAVTGILEYCSESDVPTESPTEPPDNARVHIRLNELTGILEYCSESDAETVVSNSNSGSSVIEMIPVSVAE